MKNAIRYIVGTIAFGIFFIFIDSSGVEFKSHIAKIKEWANK